MQPFDVLTCLIYTLWIDRVSLVVEKNGKGDVSEWGNSIVFICVRKIFFSGPFQAILFMKYEEKIDNKEGRIYWFSFSISLLKGLT